MRSLFHLVGSGVLCGGGAFSCALVVVLHNLCRDDKIPAVGRDDEIHVRSFPSFLAVAPVPCMLSETELAAFLKEQISEWLRYGVLGNTLDGIHCEEKVNWNGFLELFFGIVSLMV